VVVADKVDLDTEGLSPVIDFSKVGLDSFFRCLFFGGSYVG
jgi:hypothetical protein